MLLVISATETIKKSYLAYFLNSKLNSTECCTFEDYKDQYPFHYKMQFRDIFYDYNINNSVTFPEGGNYKQLLDQYANRNNEVLVITGSYSRGFVEMISNDVKDIKILNIVRNPSATYILDSSFEDKHGPYDTELKIKLLKRRYISSILNSITLKNIKSVHTIPFEIMLKEQQIENIKLPSIYKSYNNWLSFSDKFHLSFNLKTDQEDLTMFNQTFSNLADNLKNTNFDLPNALIDNLPQDIFKMLNYKPLTLEQINGYSF